MLESVKLIGFDPAGNQVYQEMEEWSLMEKDTITVKFINARLSLVKRRSRIFSPQVRLQTNCCKPLLITKLTKENNLAGYVLKSLHKMSGILKSPTIVYT